MNEETERGIAQLTQLYAKHTSQYFRALLAEGIDAPTAAAFTCSYVNALVAMPPKAIAPRDDKP